MSDEPLIDPDAIFIPDASPEELESTAAQLIQDGKDVAQAGQDIKSSWQSLAGVYSAPESDELLSAINPVATTGDEFSDAMGKVGEALQDFAEKAGKIKKKLLSLQSEARLFITNVASQEDWRSEPDNVTKHNDLIDQVGSQTVAYQDAERECANKITSVFGGTTFVPQGGTQCRPGEVAYGAGFWALGEDTPTPWGTPQEVDHPWYIDAWDGTVDIAAGVGEFAGGATGFYGHNGWAITPWGQAENRGYFGWDLAQGVSSLVGYRLEAHADMSLSIESTSWGEAGDAWVEVGHSIVPWREWDDRPGYVITQGGINIALTALGGVGAVKAAIQGAKGASAAARAARAAEEVAGAARHGHPGALGLAGQVGRAPAGAGALPTAGEILTTPSLWGPAAQGAFKNLLKDALGLSHNQPSVPNPGHHSFDGGRAPATGSAPDTHAGQGHGQPGSNAGSAAGSSAHHAPAHTGSGSRAPNDTSAAPHTPQHAGHASGDPTTSQIQRELDLLEERIQRHNGDIDRALDEHIRDRQPQLVGAGATARHGDTSPMASSGDGGRFSADSDAPRPPGRWGPNSDHSFTGGSSGTPLVEGDGGRGGGGAPHHGHGSGPSAGGRGHGEDGIGDGRPGTAVSPDNEKALKKADELEQSLRDAGLTNEQIASLRGDHPRIGDEWQRAASAVGQPFNKTVKNLLHPEATRFALEGASSPREFAYRYEYYKAVFDEKVRHLEDTDPRGLSHKGQSRKRSAADLTLDMDVRAQLDADHRVVREVWANDAHVDPNLPESQRDRMIRGQAGDITMGHETSAAYHARKHYRELPDGERSGDVIRDYHDSAETTIREGELVSASNTGPGAERRLYHRSVFDEKEGKYRALEALVLTRPDGKVVMLTYGTAKVA
ncbi:hypothetical protein HNR23_004134 [Nocardiopsis mwathae]|uniref:Uncharacterized protein n=1 Tax=Nocardiopsis mwathae TaxID=1472723 RepID=A0A7W9YLA7_9ACTN|nr:hypothetical protein [Nocardiopsis mwathae]MBB6174074.1 hypothetical protein [Nocardiopsis mwathae]